MKDPGHVHLWENTGDRHYRDYSRYLWRCECGEEQYTHRSEGPQKGRSPWALSDSELRLVEYLMDGHGRVWIQHHTGLKQASIQSYIYRVRVKMGLPHGKCGMVNDHEIVEAFTVYTKTLKRVAA